jgi:hypothetical protein
MSLSVVTVGTTPTVLAPEDLSRRGLIIQAPASVDLFVSFSGADNLNTTNGFLLPAGSPPFSIGFSLPSGEAGSRGFTDGWPYAVKAVVASGSAGVKVEEFL